MLLSWYQSHAEAAPQIAVVRETLPAQSGQHMNLNQPIGA